MSIETLVYALLRWNERMFKLATRLRTENPVLQRKQQQQPLLLRTQNNLLRRQQASVVVIGLSIVFTFITIFLCTLIRTQRILDDLESRACMEVPNIVFPNNHQQQQRRDDTTTLLDLSQHFIIFQPITEGQGTGNIMSGLLAVHLLGREFNRTVCVSDSYTHFHWAFRIANPTVAAACRQLLECEKPVFDMSHHIRLINYLAAPNECALKTRLESSTLPDHRILWIMANTYPCWPSSQDAIPENFFFDRYQARPRLLDMLPYRHVNNPPHTVVHLRFQDGSRDVRKGLDNTTLHNLGQSLPRDTYLVSNHVAFFDFFERNYGWEHPDWDAVTHSALAISWGNRQNESVPPSRMMVRTRNEAEQERQTMQLWADWYTLLRAKYIVHTSSDFSSSAAHWMNIDSMIIEGSSSPEDPTTTNDHAATAAAVRLVPESWRRDDNDCVPLVERTKQQLQRCNEDPTLNGATIVSAAAFRGAKLKINKHQG
jgi:hypothetical protein